MRRWSWESVKLFSRARLTLLSLPLCTCSNEGWPCAVQSHGPSQRVVRCLPPLAIYFSFLLDWRIHADLGMSLSICSAPAFLLHDMHTCRRAASACESSTQTLPGSDWCQRSRWWSISPRGGCRGGRVWMLSENVMVVSLLSQDVFWLAAIQECCILSWDTAELVGDIVEHTSW